MLSSVEVPDHPILGIINNLSGDSKMSDIQIQTVSFHDTTLITFQHDNVIYTAVRPIVEALGMSWGSQSVKLNKNKEKFNCFDIETVGSDGKKRTMLCMPIRKLNGWLFSINPEKVRADLKAKVIQYQEECFEVLHDYWTKGVAFNPRLTSEQTLALRDAVNMATGVLKLDYSTIYKMIHQRFNVGHIKELSVEQLEQAVEYVHRLMCGSNMNEQEANYNAQWRLIGLLEFERFSKELNQLQDNLSKISQDLYRIRRTKGLIYDAISQQQIHATDDYKQRLAEAQAFIAKQHESKKVFFGE